MNTKYKPSPRIQLVLMRTHAEAMQFAVDGPQQRRNRSGSIARRLYALQRGPSAFVAEMEIASHVQEGAGAPGSGKRR